MTSIAIMTALAPQGLASRRFVLLSRWIKVDPIEIELGIKALSDLFALFLKRFLVDKGKIGFDMISCMIS